MSTNPTKHTELPKVKPKRRNARARYVLKMTPREMRLALIALRYLRDQGEQHKAAGGSWRGFMWLHSLGLLGKVDEVRREEIAGLQGYLEKRLHDTL